MSTTQLVSFNALFNCNDVATAHCRVNGAKCSKQAHKTWKGFSPPKVNFSMWSLFPVYYNLFLLIQMENSSIILLSFVKICKCKYYLQAPVAVANMK